MERSTLTYNISSLITYEQTVLHPYLAPPDEGILINIEEPVFDGGELSFRLLVSLCFSRTFVDAFENFKLAPTILLEDAAAGRAAAGSFADPHKRYLPRNYPNYKGEKIQTPKQGYKKQFVNIPLIMAVTPSDFSPSVFVTVALQEYLSNTIGINLDNATGASFIDGIPVELPFENDNSQ